MTVPKTRTTTARSIRESQKKTVLMTLEHIRAHQTEVDRNTEWRDLRAQRRRSELLVDLLDWYNARLQRIERELDQVLHAPGPRRSEQSERIGTGAPFRRNT
jgi:hypothetical protein